MTDERSSLLVQTPIPTKAEVLAALRVLLRTQKRLERGMEWGFSYEREFILGNPIAARCVRCAYFWAERDAIRAPSLRGCSCFWCHGELVALDAEAYAERLRTLHLHRLPQQELLELVEEAA
jgi:hypothetical protein